VPVAPLDQLTPEVGAQVRVAGSDYAVWLLDDGSVWVLDNACAHRGNPLVDGALQDGCVICPWHGWVYRLDTGALRTATGDVPGVGAYPAWVADGTAWSDLPAPDRG